MLKLLRSTKLVKPEKDKVEISSNSRGELNNRDK